MTVDTNSESELDKIFDAKPMEDVPEDIWQTIYATWTGLWTDAYGQWDEKQPSDLFPVSDLLSKERLETLKSAILAWHHQQLEAKIAEAEFKLLARINTGDYGKHNTVKQTTMAIIAEKGQTEVDFYQYGKGRPNGKG